LYSFLISFCLSLARIKPISFHNATNQEPDT
jgi:hypothetical protein